MIIHVKAPGYDLWSGICDNLEEAKKRFRYKHGLKKLPTGTIVTSNPRNEFLKKALRKPRAKKGSSK